MIAPKSSDALRATKRARGVRSQPMPLGATQVSLEVACEWVAELRDFEAARVLGVVSRGPLLFFPHARRNGDGSWRVPARDVRALLGVGLPERAVSARTFAGWCEVHPKTVVRAMRRGEIAKVVLFGEWRIPVSEFARLMGVGSPSLGASVRGGGFSFFSRGAGSAGVQG